MNAASREKANLGAGAQGVEMSVQVPGLDWRFDLRREQHPGVDPSVPGGGAFGMPTEYPTGDTPVALVAGALAGAVPGGGAFGVLH